MPTESEQRQAVVDEARTWLRTPHHNGARIKGVGVDCGQLPIAVFSSLGLIPDIKPERYPSDFHLHKDREWYLEIAVMYGHEFEGPPQKGDFVLYKIGRIYSHGAIVVEWPRIIHAVVNLGVTEDDGEQGMFASKHVKGRKFFTAWGN